VFDNLQKEKQEGAYFQNTLFAVLHVSVILVNIYCKVNRLAYKHSRTADIIQDGIKKCVLLHLIRHPPYRKMILIKKSLPARGLGAGLRPPHHKNQLVSKCYTGPRIWTDALERPRQWKMNMRFWNMEC
jgi:hypothetical protein